MGTPRITYRNLWDRTLVRDRALDPGRELHLAAIRALREIGTIDSVDALHAAPPALAPEASAAIAAIHARAPAGTPGQLALASDDAAGRLSAAAAPGSVSLARKN
jgi:hypothetical protein